MNGDVAAEAALAAAAAAGLKQQQQQQKAAVAAPPKMSKLESALDKLGQKRKLADEAGDDKTKKKKRLDDIMFGLGAAKGVKLDKAGNKEEAGNKQDKMPDLSKLQEMLGGPTDSKVQKWLADQVTTN